VTAEVSAGILEATGTGGEPDAATTGVGVSTFAAGDVDAGLAARPEVQAESRRARRIALVFRTIV
jgi:hypothetical protein